MNPDQKMPHIIIPSIWQRWLVGLSLIFFLAACSQTTTGDPDAGQPAVRPTLTQFIFPPTYTPGPSATPTLTPAPRGTRTPVPTATEAPTLAPSATPLYEVIQADTSNLPAIPSNLLYASGGEVRLWEFTTLTVRPLDAELPSDFVRVSISNAGLYVAGAQKTEAGLHILIFNRLAGMPVYEVDVKAGELLDLAISPNGAGLVVLIKEGGEEDGREENLSTPEMTASPVDPRVVTPAPTATRTQTPERTIPKTILYFVDLLNSRPPVEVDQCAETCTPVLWLPSSNAFVWGDDEGLQVAEVTGASSPVPEIAAEPYLISVSARAQQTGSYLPLSVSPSGRYVIARKGIYTGSVLAVVDLISGRVESLPGTGAYTGASTGVTWHAGDLVVIARPGIARLELAPAIEIWAIDPNADETMYQLFGLHEISANYDLVPNSPAQLQDGRIGFSLSNFREPDDPQGNGLYVLDQSTGQIVQVNYLPRVTIEAVLWAPDGSSALLQTASRVLYISAGFGQIYSIGPFLGRQGCCYIWVP